jgi:UDP-N-acetylmuramoyl-tripeptide--D-alanyl-D-alanine ligase
MIISELYDKFLECKSVSTDTRRVAGGELFFALKGPNFNANKFAKQAIEKGAKYAVIDDVNYAESEQYILVEDTLTALQQLANHHRKQFDIPIIGITGSNGKTTTKELMKTVLEQKYETHATAGNFNNHIGLPLTLLSMPKSTQIAILEMGDNKIGDITELCVIAEPTHGIITNIGKDHLEGFGSFEANIRAKSELFNYLLQNNGLPLINSLDPILKNMSKRFPSPVFYGADGDYSDMKYVIANPFISYINSEEKVVATKLIGRYNFENIQTAVCVGKVFEVNPKEMHKAIAEYEPSNNRSQLVMKGSNTIILDAYNANPSSVEKALESLQETETELQKVAVLGDMLELGTTSESEHKAIVELTQKLGLANVYFCGSEFYKHNSSNGKFFPTKQDFIKHIDSAPIGNSLILLKGSRGIALETLLENL